MHRAHFVAASALLLGSCAAGLAMEGMAARAALGGARLGAVEAAGARAATAGGAWAAGSQAGAARAAARMLVDRSVASSSGGRLGTALSELSAGRSTLVVERNGLIRLGSERVGVLEGTSVTINGQAVAGLERGLLYELGGAQPIARLRGVLPGSGTRLDFVGGSSTSIIQPMIVDVLELSGGRYFVRLASGQEAWLTGGLAALALVAAGGGDDCDPDAGGGVLLRKSGQPLLFDRCEAGEDVYRLDTQEGYIAVDGNEVASIAYGATEIETAKLAQWS